MLNILVHKIPKEIPAGMQKYADQLKKTKSRGQCLQKAYEIISRRFKSSRIHTINIVALLQTDINKAWQQKVLHCNFLNYFLKVLLVKSKWFSEKDFRNKWTLVWYVSPHQYMQVRLGRKWVNVDAWGASHKIPFGSYAHGFH